ncbi:MAG TPA: hypothetical protein VG755_18170 [Nannocystaceae bacterium]|nr:hypothetical protein [Nannocystaceae bacterium]
MAATQCEQEGDVARAMSIHARIARFDPDPAVRARIAEMQLRAGQRTQGAETWDVVAREELRLGRVAHALAAARAALTAEPTPARRMLVADTAQHAGQLELTCEQLQLLAIDELAAGRHARAQALCLRALRLLPTHVPTLRVAMDAFLRGRDAHRAVEAIRALLRIDRDDRVAIEGVAEVFALIGKKDRAAEVVKLLALRLSDDGLRDDARALVRRAITWRPGDATLTELQQQLDARTPVPKVMAESTRVLDLGDLIQMAPPRAPTPPPVAAVPKHRAPPPLPGTGGWATR